jgi:hypothetical protein
MQRIVPYTAGFFFAASAVFHLVRLTTGIEIEIGGIAVPMWGSYTGALIVALLAAWMVVAARRAQA